MKRGSTLFLKFVICVIALAVISFVAFTLPKVMTARIMGGYRPIIIGMYLTAIPFLYALYQALNLLRYIDKNKAFSELSVTALQHIKYSALVIGGAYTAGMPYIYIVADRDDAPGVIVIGLFFVFASVVVATFAAVLQKLVQNGLDLKSENDLTV